MKNSTKNLKPYETLSLKKPTKKAVLVVNQVDFEEAIDLLISAASQVEEDLGVEFIADLVQERPLVSKILQEAFDPHFIQACSMTLVGQGILLGLVNNLLQQHLDLLEADKLENEESEES